MASLLSEAASLHAIHLALLSHFYAQISPSQTLGCGERARSPSAEAAACVVLVPADRPLHSCHTIPIPILSHPSSDQRFPLPVRVRTHGCTTRRSLCCSVHSCIGPSLRSPSSALWSLPPASHCDRSVLWSRRPPCSATFRRHASIRGVEFRLFEASVFSCPLPIASFTARVKCPLLRRFIVEVNSKRVTA